MTIISKVEGTQTKQSQWFTSWEWRWRNFIMERFENLGNDELNLWLEILWRIIDHGDDYNDYNDDPSDEEACGDARSRLRRLRREGWDQCEELHRLQGEGGQDTDHPGWERESWQKKKNILLLPRWVPAWCSRARLCAGSATAEERSFLRAAGERQRQPLSFWPILINTTGAKVAKGRRRRRRRKW